MGTISQAAIDLIVNAEVSGKQVYERKYQHPEWPGGASGITIGIGYDCGYQTGPQLWLDWSGKIPDDMIFALDKVVGLKGNTARDALTSIRNRVTVPWDAAMAVFSNTDVPRWIASTEAALPNANLLSPDSLGALVSLCYNRGADFVSGSDRRMEMRNIKAHMQAKEFAKIPQEFRNMKRVWPEMKGLRDRRDAEANLFQRGLSSTTIGA